MRHVCLPLSARPAIAPLAPDGLPKLASWLKRSSSGSVSGTSKPVSIRSLRLSATLGGIPGVPRCNAVEPASTTNSPPRSIARPLAFLMSAMNTGDPAPPSNQLELTLGDIEEQIAEMMPPEPEQPPAPARPTSASVEPARRKPVRRPLPDSLPRDVVEHAAPCACPKCGGVLRPLGEDVTEVLDYVPACFRVIRHVRPKLSCRSCESIAQAPVPSLPIQRGLATPALLAHVLVAKYADHCPLYRQ